jgi:N-acetylneuraminic acid mutarotase
MPRPLPFHRILTLGTLSLLGLAACGENAIPAQPEMEGEPGASAWSLAATSNSWTSKASPPFGADIYGFDLGMAPNSAGQSVVYTFGGTSSDDGGTGIGVQAYNVATNVWTGRSSRVGVWYSNGVGKIGNKLYFSGGYNEHDTPLSFTNQLWAYDYSSDRMIAKANLPIFSAEGVTGVINGKLYVLPGACSEDRYPNPGYCAAEPTRRLYRYDPATNTWVTRRQAPHFHRHGAAAVIDGKFYVAGGFNNFQPVTDLDVYDPGTNTWSTLAPVPTGGAASGAVSGGRFYVVVQSFNGTTPNNRAYGYNRSTNQWKTITAPDFFGSATRVSLNGSSYLFMATGANSALYTP